MRLLGNLLFGTSSRDPMTCAGACALFVGVTVAASYVPVRRAMAVEPIEALRQD